MADDLNNEPNMEGEEDGEGEEQQQEQKYPNLAKDQAVKDQLDEVFDIFDKDRDNQIDHGELGTLLRIMGFNPTERELKEFIDKHDQSQNTVLTRQNVYAIVDQKMNDTDTTEELIEAMKLFDYDQDGKLTVPDIRWAMAKLGDVMDEQAIDEMIKVIDEENTGLVDINAFADVCFNKKPEKKEAPPPKKK